MKRGIALALIVGLALGGLWLAHRQKSDAPVSPAALLNMLADWQREASRLPMRATRMSDADEIRAGDSLAQTYTSQFAQPSTARELAVEAYVRKVGASLAGRAKRRLPWTFHYIPDEGFVNAFALPGGHIFIGQGMISIMDSEDQLAAVLGHEIEHIDHYHAAERLQVEAKLRQLNLGVLGSLASIPVAVFQAGYGKQQEFEADREGMRLAAKTGYSTQGSVRLFERMAEMHEEYVIKARTPPGEISRLALESLKGYFRSHPAPRERAAMLRKTIAEDGWPLRQERDLKVTRAQAAR
jgi:predicted Zn-dependent protease